MDDQTRSIIRNVKGPGMHKFPTRSTGSKEGASSGENRARIEVLTSCTVRENDILCLLESEREARRLR